MAKKIQAITKIEPNLTPLLDVSFQLISFFIMVTNFSQDTYDQRVHLPVAGSAKPVENAAEDRLTLNIDKRGHLLWEGKELDSNAAVSEIRLQVQLIRLNAKSAGKELKAGEPLPTTIVVRADRDTPFGQLMKLITACQGFGFSKFALKAMHEEG